MISGLFNFVNVSGPWPSCNGVVGSIDWSSVLPYADWVLIGAGLAVSLAALLRASRPGGDSFWRFSPGRERRMVPEAVLIPLLAFFGATIAAQALVGAGLPNTEKRVEVGDRPPNAEEGVEEGAGLPNAEEAFEVGPVRETLVSDISFLVGAIVSFLVGRAYIATEERGFVAGGGRIKREAGLALGFGLSIIALCHVAALATGALISLSLPEYEFSDHAVVEILRDPDRPSLLLPVLWIGTAGLTPVAEEFFFRGLLQNGLSRLFKSRWSGVVATAFIFGLAHGTQPHVVPAMVLFGIIVGIQYERRGSLVGPIITHAIFNAKTLLWVTLAGPGG